MNIIFDYNRTLFNPDSGQLFPDTFLVLKTLARKHSLFLVTLDKPERKTSAYLTELQPFFAQTAFVKRKTKAVFLELVSSNDQPTIVIGDRLEDEILIGLKLNFITIHIPAANGQPNRRITPKHKVSALKKILPIIEAYE